MARSKPTWMNEVEMKSDDVYFLSIFNMNALVKGWKWSWNEKRDDVYFVMKVIRDVKIPKDLLKERMIFQRDAHYCGWDFTSFLHSPTKNVLN